MEEYSIAIEVSIQEKIGKIILNGCIATKKSHHWRKNLWISGKPKAKDNLLCDNMII